MVEKKILDGTSITYSDHGEGHTVLFLHGWGGNHAVFKDVVKKLDDNYRIISMDLPGFGESSVPDTVWSTDDYVLLVKKFLTELNVERPTVVGHSFGGKIASILSLSCSLEKLVLVGSAGVRLPKAFDTKLKIAAYKLAKPFLRFFPQNSSSSLINYVRNSFGSADYQNSSSTMRSILVKSVNEDIRDRLPGISVPTLLIWGEDDTATPVEAARYFEKLIEGSGLVIMKGCGHYCFLDDLSYFSIVLNHFIKTDL